MVSYIHGWLYEKWTLPDAEWMTATQMARFQYLIQNMIKDMREAIKRLEHRGQTIYCYLLES